MNRRTVKHKRSYHSSSRTRERRHRRNKHSGFGWLLVAIFIMSAFLSTGATASKIADTETMCVSRGDTLWEIATECNTNGDDVRDIMDDIMKLNNMKTVQLQVGEKLIIPIY